MISNTVFSTPVAAAAYLTAHPAPGTHFNDVGIGSYLMWARGSEQPLFIDPRVELFPRSLWDDYMLLGQATRYHELLIDKYHITRVILSRTDQGGLVRALAHDPLWQREYSDLHVEIFRRVAR